MTLHVLKETKIARNLFSTHCSCGWHSYGSEDMNDAVKAWSEHLAENSPPSEETVAETKSSLLEIADFLDAT